MNFKFWKTDPCRDAELLIQQSLDAPLRPAERQRLDRHLATCESCRQAWDEYRRLSRTATQWTTAAVTDPGDEFTQRVMAELGLPAMSPASSPSHDREPAKRGRPAWAGWAVAGAGAAVIAVAVAFVPSVGHYTSTLSAYVPTLHLAPSPVDALGSLARPPAIHLPEIADVLSPLRSLTWPVYAFVAALAANVAMAGAMARQRRRAL